MPNIGEVLKRALERKRAEAMKKALEGRPSPESAGGFIMVKYVTCRTCEQYQSWDAFMIMHGGNPHFCRCPPGDEDLVTFHLSIRRADVDDEVKGV